MKPITIGITDCSKYEKYRQWITAGKNTEVIRLSHHENNLNEITKCDGILLTGGEDVHPRYYKKNEFLELCQELDESRDAFEWKVLDYTVQHKVPLLGICRGLQIANVYFGGTLVPDIPAFGKFDHSKTGPADRYHSLLVDPYSLLQEIVQVQEGEVNSAHHQAADRIGKGLVANALSPDGIVEGLERDDKKDEAFLLLVQWHPERMNDQESAFSKSIRNAFIHNVRISKDECSL